VAEALDRGRVELAGGVEEVTVAGHHGFCSLSGPEAASLHAFVVLHI
jgi:hypothetical protein